MPGCGTRARSSVTSVCGSASRRSGSWWIFRRCAAEHRGGLGTSAVNGLVLAGMFDLALGSTVVLVHPHRRSATIQLSMSFERAVFGNSARCEAVIDRLGQRTLFASARILDEQGVVCARCQAVVAVSRQAADGPADGPSG